MNLLLDSEKAIVPATVYGFDVLPTTKIYYDHFHYKVSLIGNSIAYDIFKHQEINDWLSSFTDWDYRTGWTMKSRNVYFRHRDTFLDFVKNFSNKNIILSLHGILSKEHIEFLTNTSSARVTKIFRNKKWYKKYDTKVEIWTSLLPEATSEERFLAFDKLSNFIENNLDNFQWYSSGSHSWRSNYLYCEYKQLEEILPFLILSHDDIIYDIYKIHNFNDK